MAHNSLAKKKMKKDDTPNALDARKEQILEAVVNEYISSAEPIASEMIAQKYQLGVRSATIRNELVDLSQLGYLAQPHTSAGRIPSDLGYRYFIDHMVVLRDIDSDSKTRVRQTTEAGEVLQNILQSSTSLLSNMTMLLSAAVTFSDQNARVVNAMVSALSSETALLVLIFSSGHVENRLIQCPPGLSLADIGKINDELKVKVAEKSVSVLLSIKTSSDQPPGPYSKFHQSVMQMLKSIAKKMTVGKFFVAGQEYLFTQPEFAKNPSPVDRLLQGFREGDAMQQEILNPTSENPNVSIGTENSSLPMQPFSIIRQSFSVRGQKSGVIALIGPTRMDYAYTIPVLDFHAYAISQVLSRMLP